MLILNQLVVHNLEFFLRYGFLLAYIVVFCVQCFEAVSRIKIRCKAIVWGSDFVFIDPATVLSMFFLSFFLLIYGRFEWKRICAVFPTSYVVIFSVFSERRFFRH
jgi:hypothetical protein